MFSHCPRYMAFDSSDASDAEPLNSFLGSIAIDIVIPLPSSCGPDLDLDRDSYVNASTDGLLLLRAMLGFRGSSLVNEAVNGCGMRLSADDIASVVAQYARSNTVNADGVGQPPAGFRDHGCTVISCATCWGCAFSLVAGAVDHGVITPRRRHRAIPDTRVLLDHK